MILPSQSRVDILRAAQRDALNHADVWIGIAKYLENLIENEENGVDTPDRPLYDADGIQFTYTGEARQGNDLSRGRSRGDDAVRDSDIAVGSSVRTGGTLQ